MLSPFPRRTRLKLRGHAFLFVALTAVRCASGTAVVSSVDQAVIGEILNDPRLAGESQLVSRQTVEPQLLDIASDFTKPGIPIDVINELSRRNRSSATLIGIPKNVVLVDDPTTVSRTRGVLGLSLPAFSKDGRHAVIYVTDLCDGLCGWGMLAYLELSDRWRVVELRQVWGG